MGNSYEHFQTSKAIIPCLSVPIERSIPENPDVLPSPLPERNALLKGMIEVVVLPVLDVIRKQDRAIELHLDIIQERQIQLFANDEGLALGKDERAAMVGFLEAFEEFSRDIVGVAL